MIFGFNTDVQGKDALYHVQTEDRGHKNPVVESIIYVGGKILGKSRTLYDPATSSKEQIEEAVRHQHKELTEAVRNGTWLPTPQPVPAAPPSLASDSVASAAMGGNGSAISTPVYLIEMTNANEFQQGEYFRFQFAFRERDSNFPASDLALDIRWIVDGQVIDQQTLNSRRDGGAEIWVSSPEISQAGMLIIRAKGPQGKQFAKFNIQPVA
ncbi:MAG: hypothetical protein EXQ56_01015 [Acidobacteria bacterium]|nr:hypothetical protein [Acidobacteriota bacterium]